MYVIYEYRSMISMSNTVFPDGSTIYIYICISFFCLVSACQVAPAFSIAYSEL